MKDTYIVGCITRNDKLVDTTSLEFAQGAIYGIYCLLNKLCIDQNRYAIYTLDEWNKVNPQ